MRIKCTDNGVIVPCSDHTINMSYIPTEITLLGLMTVLAFMLFTIIIPFWKIYKKAGKPGWASIVPVYNIVVLLEITKKPIWWIFLFFIPFVNIIIAIIVYNELSKGFGKGVGYTFGLIFLPFIFLPILGYGKAQYTDPAPSVIV